MTAADEQEAFAKVRGRPDFIKRLRNGDTLGWRLEHTPCSECATKTETWEVTQDGAVFYVKPGDEELTDVYHYPRPVDKGDKRDLEHARAWFVGRIVPREGVKVVWKG